MFHWVQQLFFGGLRVSAGILVAANRNDYRVVAQVVRYCVIPDLCENRPKVIHEG